MTQLNKSPGAPYYVPSVEAMRYIPSSDMMQMDPFLAALLVGTPSPRLKTPVARYWSLACRSSNKFRANPDRIDQAWQPYNFSGVCTVPSSYTCTQVLLSEQKKDMD